MLIFDIENAIEEPTSPCTLSVDAPLNELTQAYPATVAYARQCLHPWELLTYVNPQLNNKARNYFVMRELVHFLSPPHSSLHLCEAPGHFAQVMEDMIKKVDWHATSLALAAATEGTFSFSSNLLAAKHPNGHARVSFGADGTGNLLMRHNAYHVIQEVGTNNVQLVTADASTTDIRLLCAEIYVALRTLSLGGHLVLRVNVDQLQDNEELQILVSYLQQIFTNVYITRPAALQTWVADVYLVARCVRPNVVDALRTIVRQLHDRAFEASSTKLMSIPALLLLNNNTPLIARHLQIQRQVAFHEIYVLSVYFIHMGLISAETIQYHRAAHLLTNPKRLAQARSVQVSCQ